jgi:hypothetical protein
MRGFTPVAFALDLDLAPTDRGLADDDDDDDEDDEDDDGERIALRLTKGVHKGYTRLHKGCAKGYAGNAARTSTQKQST